ncbi:hypothetical protein [Streptomyces sp. NRRL S-118]|uniref:hypothetical protein n=1 Tax=Streptomyces sp. NRRL S-118 TaxID=1463881 RepID=UPI0004CBCA3E|nr:hypothetical protein [Streptomyces sp. NRRL S-118]
MEAAILILALLFVAFVALGVYVTVKAVNAAKRGVDRTITQARRTVEDTTLRAKSYGQGGVGGELAQLRLSLRTSMRATQDALEAGAVEDASVKESLELFRRLSAHGHELDDDLKRMERDPDRARVAAQLGDLRERTERITHAADSLRWAARDRARRFADDDLANLSAQIDIEAGALRHWPEESGGRDDFRWPEAAAGQAPERSHPAGAGDAGAPEPEATSGPQPGGDEPAAPAERPAITARDPRLPHGYAWQKSTRPETTN